MSPEQRQRLSESGAVRALVSGAAGFIGPCVAWPGARINSDGYAYVTWNGRTRVAHRVAYEEVHGKVLVGMHLDHLCHSFDSSCRGGPSCRHRRCINPNHLEVVTPQENASRSRNRHAEKTACPAGHSYDAENTYRVGSERRCKECNRRAAREYQRRRRAAAA